MNNDHQRSDVNRHPVNGGTCVRPAGKGPGTFVAGPAGRAAAEAVSEPVSKTSSRAVADRAAEEGAAKAVDPARERAYWSENFSQRRYVREGSSFDDYGPAYGFGTTARARYPGRDFDDVASELSSDWAANRGESSLSWGRARHAARVAWNRISEST